MNAPVQLTEQQLLDIKPKSGLALDKKRYLWMISPSLPVIGLGILAGYHVAPKPLKKVFALGGPIVLHVIIPAIDSLIGKDQNNPTAEDVKLLEQDPYYSRLVKSFIPIQYAANVYACYLVGRKQTSLLDKMSIHMDTISVQQLQKTLHLHKWVKLFMSFYHEQSLDHLSLQLKSKPTALNEKGLDFGVKTMSCCKVGA